MHKNKNEALSSLVRLIWSYPDKREYIYNFFGYIRKYSYICTINQVIFYDSKRAVY